MTWKKRRDNNMREKISKLINVKSIVTIILTLVFSYMSVVNRISSDQFLTVFSIVIAFYFGTQMNKNVEV